MQLSVNEIPKIKAGRNDSCPCGSGKKFKKCCINKMFNKPVRDYKDVKEFYLKAFKIRIKEKVDIERIKKTGKMVIDLLDMAEEAIKPGITTNYLNTLLHDYMVKNRATPATLNYQEYPKSICVAVNEVVCHGIPDQRVLKDGDIVNVDVTPILDGYLADANKTFFVGSPGYDAQKIVRVAKECLNVGMSMVKPRNFIGDIGWAIEEYANSQGCSIVHDYVGHGVGFQFHEYPLVPHFGQRGHGIMLVPGMVFTIEPMVNLGDRHVYVLPDKWTAMTKDGSLSAQFEQTVLVTENGYESLTPYY